MEGARRRTRRIEAERLTTLALLALPLSLSLSLYLFPSLSSPFLHSLTHSLTHSFSAPCGWTDGDDRRRSRVRYLRARGGGRGEEGEGRRDGRASGGREGLLRGGTAVYYRHLATRQRRRRHVVRSTRVVNVNAMTARVRVRMCAFSRAFSPLDPRGRPRSPLRFVPFRFAPFRSVPWDTRVHARTHISYARARVCVCVRRCVAHTLGSARRRGPLSRFSFGARAPVASPRTNRGIFRDRAEEQEAHRRGRMRRSCVLGSPHPAAAAARADFVAGRSLYSRFVARSGRLVPARPGVQNENLFIYTCAREREREGDPPEELSRTIASSRRESSTFRFRDPYFRPSRRLSAGSFRLFCRFRSEAEKHCRRRIDAVQYTPDNRALRCSECRCTPLRCFSSARPY